jgi:hypothetical protein
MFLRANAGEKMGLALAQPRQPQKFGFLRREIGWPGILFWYRGPMRCLDWPFFSQTQKGGYYVDRGPMQCLLETHLDPAKIRRKIGPDLRQFWPWSSELPLN